MKKLSFTWSLMNAAWEVLKKDKELLIFSLISAICTILVSLSFIVPLYASGNWLPPEGNSSLQAAIYYLILFAFYFCNYFIIVFFNSAIIACAKIRMEGGDPTVSDGFQAAGARLALIAGWALIAASVGLILRIIEDRFEKVGRFVAGLLGMAWSVVSFLVIPILVIEKKGPIAAFRESSILLKKTWGEQLIGNFSFGLVFFLLGIPAFLVIFLAALSGNSPALISVMVLAAMYLLMLALVQSTLQAVFQAAVYLYARTGQVPQGFQSALLMNSMAQKQ
jgi:hypothetical protein